MNPAKVAFMIASAAISAIGSISQGRAAQRNANAQASALIRQGERDKKIAKLNADEALREKDRLLGKVRAEASGTGRLLTEGSVLAILGDIEADAAYRALLIEAGGDEADRSARESAAIARAEGADASRAGFFKAGGTLLTAASKLDFKDGALVLGRTA